MCSGVKEKALLFSLVSGYTLRIKLIVFGYSMFLTFGLNENKELTSIREVKSGKTSLVCPYCKQTLIAKKGKVKEHHFAHSGKTCAISLQAAKASLLPTFDKFELLSNAESTYLERRSRYQHKDIYHFKGMDEAVSSLELMGILKVEYEDPVKNETVETVNGKLKAVNRNLIVDGKPSKILQDILVAIEPLTYHNLLDYWDNTPKALSTSINRSYHANKLDKQTQFKQFLKAQNYWFDCHYKKIAHSEPEFLPLLHGKIGQLNLQHLYIFEFLLNMDGNENQPIQLIKIGMTTRNPNNRLKEVVQALRPHSKVIKSKVLVSCEHAGRLERLLHHHYQDKQLKIGTFTEFFALENEEIDTLVKDMQTTTCEQYVPPVVKIKKALQVAGRKKKTDAELIEEYADIVDCLKNGMGIRETARQTRSGVNTVQRVKKAMR